MGTVARGVKSATGSTNFGSDTVAKSSEINADLNNIYSEFNGGIDNDNVAADAAIAASKLNLTSIAQNVNVSGSLTTASLQLTTSTLITGIFDQDDMLSNSATAVPTQQSVKAYVDGKFNTTTGHDHDGSDAKKVVATNLDLTGITNGHYLYNNAGTVAGQTITALSIKVSTITRDIAGNTEDVAYTGVGFLPKAVVFLVSNLQAGSLSFGASSGTAHIAASAIWGGAINSTVTNQCICLGSSTTGNFGVIKSFDADGFTITWTKNGSPSNASHTIGYLAIA